MSMVGGFPKDLDIKATVNAEVNCHPNPILPPDTTTEFPDDTTRTVLSYTATGNGTKVRWIGASGDVFGDYVVKLNGTKIRASSSHPAKGNDVEFLWHECLPLNDGDILTVEFTPCRVVEPFGIGNPAKICSSLQGFRVP